MCATAMVMPRAFSSGALSMESKERNFTFGLCFASVLVMAAVSVVLPWSMWPMLTCGLLRSNFSFAILLLPDSLLNSLLRYLALYAGDDLFGNVLRDLFVLPEVHGEAAAALGARAQLGSVAEHFRQRHHGLDQLRGSARFGSFQTSTARDQIAIDRTHVVLGDHDLDAHDRLQQHRLRFSAGFLDADGGADLERHF